MRESERRAGPVVYPPRVHRALRSLAVVAALAFAACVPEQPVAPIPAPPTHTPPAATSSAPVPALPPSEPAPLERLPADVRPVHAALTLRIDPAKDRFSGAADITVDLTKPRNVIWLHGKGLTGRAATAAVEGAPPVAATYVEVDASGVAALRLERPIGPGRAVLHIEYDAAFGASDEGVHVVERGGKRYAFTQFEAIAARAAVPCFDEPSFKIPFDVTLDVPKNLEAIANSREIKRAYAEGDVARISFATTPPLPSYLLAFAVGPLDVVNGPVLQPTAVRKRQVRLRGVATSGRGKELAYALAHTGEILTALEGYLGIEYPYDKLDLIAVPDKGGAMENPGAITFAEKLLLLDDASAPTLQKRAFWRVMTHELAHQWFGNLVTMPWWDDIWLNEAFATWATSRLLPEMRPDEGYELDRVEDTHRAMRADSLISARKIRQEVHTVHDIQNGFDGITYQKGSGVIAMFERWMGKDPFRAGVRSYLTSHQNGTASADDLFAALTVAAGRDVGGAFRTFVNQPGVPLVEAKLSCGRDGNFLSLRQSRYLPAGSAGDPQRSWQIPVCAKVPDGKSTQEVCTLLTGPEASLPLPGKKCPAWALPNAGAAGYFTLSMPPADMKKLTRAAWKELTLPERLAVTHGLSASWARGAPVADVLPILAPLATEPDHLVVRAAMEPYEVARGWFSGADRVTVEKQAQRAFKRAWRDVDWQPKKGKTDGEERRALRAELVKFLALAARDPAVRKEAIKRGQAYVGFGGDGALHPDVADKDLLDTCLFAAAEEGDAAFFDHVLGLFARSSEEVVRARLLGALGAFQAPALQARALALSFDPRVRANELLLVLKGQLARPETRAAAFEWFKVNVDGLAAKLPPSSRGVLPLLGAPMCDRAQADALSKLFEGRIQRLEGGPRNLASALEAIHLCAARRSAQLPSFRKAFRMKERSADLYEP